ncbi:hypothetical protein TIFTF001_027434 [Ficus carica]|uniref:HVA22-like protein n=1 Tax=Ficus carica TaxID=3494 RepID=A0AA88DMZ0_FICCA|nr:hypothetical protein TIFTF001_027434 [Ficus carica]
MGFLGLLQFFVKYFVDVIAWPLLALAYPLLASVRAIESNSFADTQKLNTYWVVFSSILLLEHILSLFHWFPFWRYLRLIIVGLLVIPYFKGAFYVYKQVTSSLLSINAQIIINWFTKPKEASAETEKILAKVEKYVRENGAEALEKIIADGSGNANNPDVREIKAVPSIDNEVVNQVTSNGPNVARKDINAVEEIKKNEVKAATQPTSNGPNVARKDIKTMVEIEKNEVKAAMQVSRVKPEVTPTENIITLHTETREKFYGVQTRRELPQTPDSNIGQRNWKCAICKVTVKSQVDFDSHLRGKKHKTAMEEAVKAKNGTVGPKDPPSVKAKNGTVGPKDLSLSCKVCNIRCTGKANMDAHLRGQKHLTQVRLLATK